VLSCRPQTTLPGQCCAGGQAIRRGVGVAVGAADLAAVVELLGEGGAGAGETERNNLLSMLAQSVASLFG
jgi:hypothetical protein